MTNPTQNHISHLWRGPFAAVTTAYYLTLLAYLLAAFMPDYRVWAFNNWACFPWWLPVALFVVGALIQLPVLLVARRLVNGGHDEPVLHDKPEPSWLSIVATASLAGILFYLLRPNTFFLGDGYTVISLLARDVPLVKLRNLGEDLIHIAVKNLFGFSGESGATTTYQMLSVAAGVVMVVAVLRAGFSQYRQRWDRLLFALFILSSGPMLLFFGYVENYSMFALSVAVYTLYGLRVAQGRGRWYFLPPLAALSIFLHIFGVVLLPSLVYLAGSAAPVRDRLAALSRFVKGLLSVILLALIAFVFVHFYLADWYFRFAIIPLWPDRFTVEGYWLLSPNHLVDLVNYLFLMLPSAAVLAISLLWRRSPGQWQGRDYRYLAILCLSAVGAVFLFDPKIGMPRDWDLFAFAGLPLAVTAAYGLLDRRFDRPDRRPALVLGIALGLLVLIPRVVGQAIPKVAIARINNYAALDRTRNMYGRTNLVNYYESRNDSTALAREKQRYREDYPERLVNLEGVVLKDKGDCPQAMVYFRRALEMNPIFTAAYANLAMCLQQAGQLDSALQLFRIAAGLNPYNDVIAVKLAGAYFAKGDYDRAERSLNWAVRVDPDNIDARYGLLELYERQGRRDERLAILEQLIALPKPPPAVVEDLVRSYVQLGELDKAAQALRIAVDHGLDSLAVDDILQTFPEVELIYRAR